MVNLMNDTLGEYPTAHNLFQLTSGDMNRGEAIAWMKQVRCKYSLIAPPATTLNTLTTSNQQVAIGFKMSAEARDSGILIYDKFLSLMVLENPKVLSDIYFISYSAAVSITLGTKLHDGTKCLTLVS